MTDVDARAAMHLSDASVSVELETQGMTLNIGPQHPSTHGVLRLVAKVEGERVTSVEPVIGYMHRGYEKLTEVRTYAQITALVNRIDWVSGFANEIPWIRAVEKLMEIEVPERAQWIRLILTEMTRISSHLLFMSSYPLELGAATPLMYALREREYVMDLIESVTGGRFHPNFNRVGGVKPAAGGGSTQKKVSQDLPAGFFQAPARQWTGSTRDGRARRARHRERDDPGPDHRRGSHPAEKAIEFGLSGRTAGRPASTSTCAATASLPALRPVRLRVITEQTGDCFDRYLVRKEEIRQAVRIVQPGDRHHPAGTAPGQGARSAQGAQGQAYVRTENPKGEMGFYLISEGAASRTGSRSAPPRSATSRSSRGSSRAPWFPTSSPSWAASTSSSETWTDELTDGDCGASEEFWLRRNS